MNAFNAKSSRMRKYIIELLAVILFAFSIAGWFGCNRSELLPPTHLSDTTIAAGKPGSANGIGTAASFNRPFGVAVDRAGNVYVADQGNNLIRKISPGAVVTTLAGMVGVAGSANGMDTLATFNKPFSVAVDSSGNVYVADTGNNLVRAITPAGLVSTFAGNGKEGAVNGTDSTSFRSPFGVAVDGSGNLYVADYGNNLIRMINKAGVVSTLAGTGATGADNGAGTIATFNLPESVAVDAAGNVYVADNANNLIRKITPAGVVSTLAGTGMAGSANGTGTAASFNSPFGVAVDGSGNVYVADAGNNMIRKISQAGVVITVAGSGARGANNATGAAASFNTPSGLAVDSNDNIYVADEGNNLVRKITAAGAVTTLARRSEKGVFMLKK
jgi:streptogramin lyase